MLSINLINLDIVNPINILILLVVWTPYRECFGPTAAILQLHRTSNSSRNQIEEPPHHWPESPSWPMVRMQTTLIKEVFIAAQLLVLLHVWWLECIFLITVLRIKNLVQTHPNTTSLHPQGKVEIVPTETWGSLSWWVSKDTGTFIFTWKFPPPKKNN